MIRKKEIVVNQFILSGFIYPHLSDLIRMSLLYKVGGYYVDADAIGLRPMMDFQPSYCFRPRNSDGIKITSNFFASPKNHPIMKIALDHVSKNYDVSLFK